ncbi:MAG: T9SS type A sorting domain-containing protein [Bacteroidota bacterium]
MHESVFGTLRLLNWNGSTQGLVVTDPGDDADADLTDDFCDADASRAGDQCTLRAALQTANQTAGRDEITFDLPGAAPHTISVSAALPAVTEAIVLDGTSQDGYTDRPIIHIEGAGAAGLVLQGGNSEVRGLAIGGFSVGIVLSGAGGNAIEANYIGVSPSGAASPNGTGLLVTESPDHVIGGDSDEARNIISGNTGPGIVVTGASATGVVIAGNRIGTDPAGTTALPNGAEGVLVEDAPGVQIGGPTEGERNLIAGNATHGARITGADADGVRVIGNWIGLAADGLAALPNGTDATELSGHHGVAVVSSPNAIIGGDAGTAGNVIAGNAAHGVYITGTPDAPADGVQVLGNRIGTGRSGNTALVNGAVGVAVAGAARSAQIGRAGTGNQIVAGAEGNLQGGVWLFDSGEAGGRPDNATIAANTMGFNAAGSALLGEMNTAISAVAEQEDGGFSGLMVGGEDVASGNQIRAGSGVILLGTRTNAAVIASNTIGLFANGELARPASLPDDERDAFGLLVAGTDEVQVLGNTIAGSIFGVVLASNGSVLAANQIGTNRAGTAARPNTIGVYIPGDIEGVPVGSGNVIGAEGQGNVISGNRRDGIRIGGSFDVGDEGTDGMRRASPRRVLARRPGVSTRMASSEAARQPAAGGVAPDGNVIAFNRIGTNRAGDRQLGNGRAATEPDAFPGVWIRDGRGTRIVGNVISGNGFGVLGFAGFDEEGDLDDGDPGATLIGGSIIGGSANGQSNIANQYAGVAFIGSDANRIQALSLADGGDPVGNVVRGNGQVGVLIRPIDGEQGNQVRSTSFFRNDGLSLQLLNADGDYPVEAPQVPSTLWAALTENGATLRVTTTVAGELDLFLSESCANGHAEGTLIETVTVPAGVQSVEVTNVPGGFDALGLYLAATLTQEDNAATTSGMTACTRIAGEANVVEVPVAPGETGPVVDESQIRVEITDNPNLRLANSGDGTRTAKHQAPLMQEGALARAEGTLAVSVFGERIIPQPGLFDGSASAPDGSTVTPNVVSSNRHWVLRAEDLDGVTYSVCLDDSGLGGVTAPDQLVVLHREDPGHPWVPLASTREGGRLCASGLAAWGEIGIGGDDTVNPVPNDPGPETVPTRLSVMAFPNPSRGAATVRVTVPDTGTVRASLHDALGREVTLLHDGPLSRGESAFDLPRLAPGVYLLRVLAPTASASTSLTIIR